MRIPRARIHRLFELIEDDEAEPDSKACINVVFTTAARLRFLNREYRRRDKPTDVLSFALEDGTDSGATFGEIYISVPTADQQAAAYGTSRSEEYLRLICHGLLHLFGYDHMKSVDAAAMKKREERYLACVRGEIGRHV